MAEAYCACLIANVEGLKCMPLPADGELKPTLEALDGRVRVLEIRSCVTPPPPMLDVTWDSLTWRVCRLVRSARSGRVMREWSVKKRPPLSDATSVTFLRNVVRSLDARRPFPWPPERADDKGSAVDDKDFLCRMTQWLCHLAGQRGFQVDTCTFEPGAACALAVDLAMETESGPSFYPSLPPPHPPRGAGPSPYCGCCCGRARRPRAPSVSSWAAESDRCGNCSGWRPFGWLRKLAFWRRKRPAYNDSDDDSLADTL
ncbi:hypothetical protein GGR52DRAFT_245114 [Hypoxylon sp. FL1284]|nr:hypothetical protein GGR52DRAFT_245114 [Hypoxylon sp. FL1284]